MKRKYPRSNRTLKIKKLDCDRFQNILHLDDSKEDIDLLDDFKEESDQSYSDEEQIIPINAKKEQKKEKVVIKRKTRIVEDMEDDGSEGEEIMQFTLPCREKEQNEIESNIQTGLNTTGSYSSLYISGMPGTGKTACVTAMISKIKAESEKLKEVPKFNTIYLNGMKITNPNNVFKMIYQEIFTDKKSKNHVKCLSILDNFFKQRRNDFKTNLNYISNPHLVLIIDEIDCLVTKKQSVLYNIFNWTTYSNSKLIIITISNTLDLPEKLSAKIASRIGNKRLIFKPYQTDEMIRILSTKVNSKLFSEDALRMSSMKVASVNGDLRRILQICKRAEEIYDMEGKAKGSKIEISHIQRACMDLFDSKVVNVIKNLKIYEKIILLSILFEMKLSLSNKVDVINLFDRSKFFCVKMTPNIYRLNFDEFRMVIYNLVKLRIINFTDNNSENFLSNHIFVKFYADEFINALYDDEKFKTLIDDHLNK
jgi:Cdc6-like AAA superfamily ATPase